MALHTAGCTAIGIAAYAGELLPHLFTLTGNAGGYFLLHCHSLTAICLSAAQLSAMPGLSSPTYVSATERPTA